MKNLRRDQPALFRDKVEKEPRRQETTLPECSVLRIDLLRIDLGTKIVQMVAASAIKNQYFVRTSGRQIISYNLLIYILGAIHKVTK